MAVETHILVSVNKVDGVTLPATINKGINMDDIDYAVVLPSTETRLVYTRTDSGVQEVLDVTESLAAIIALADLTTYDHDLRIIPVLQYAGQTYPGAGSPTADGVGTSFILNFKKSPEYDDWSDAKLSLVNGAKITYKYHNDRNPFFIITSTDLTNSGGGGGS